MTTDEKERLEIVKEVCSLQDCTLQEIYNFVKTGKAVTGPLPKTANNPEPPTLADGVYIVTKDGRADKFTGTNLILDCDNPVIGIGVKQGDRGVIVALKDVADGDDVTLTTCEDTTNYGGYIPNRIDAVADRNGKTNTAHLREINAALRHVGGMEIADEWYLTSTELRAATVWRLHLGNSYLGN